MNVFESKAGEAHDATCEAVGCFEKATDEIAVNVGNLGEIQVLLCSNCIFKFREVHCEK
ncbi:MAG TPA: hypothetical protein VH796_01780 [Nitrososphaeraceae archaeon]